jgi:hypothetical protein
MGFFNLFGKKSISAIITNTQNNLFRLYSVRNPSDALKMKASVYLCISGIAMINKIGESGGYAVLNELINKIVADTRELTKPLSMKVSELANDAQDLKLILSNFPVPMDANTRVNGLAAFEALYSSKVDQLIKDIMSHDGGPMGSSGYAAIVVADGIFGDGKSKDHFMEVGIEVSSFVQHLLKAYI